MLIGLTGGIGAGKSTVAEGLVARGAVLVDADAIVRELQAPGEPVFEAIVERFGPEVVAADGSLDRQAVADRVFGDDAALADLNAIVHPAVAAEMGARIASAPPDGVVVLDIPLLVESTRAPDVAGVIVVDADTELAVSRLVDQRGFTEADARARIGRQASREQRLARADFVVHNDGTLEDLEAQIDACWAWILSLGEVS